MLSLTSPVLWGQADRCWLSGKLFPVVVYAGYMHVVTYCARVLPDRDT